VSAQNDSLVAIRDSILTIITAQTAAWEAAGSPPNWSMDGESWSWDTWLISRLNELEKINTMIARSKPFFKVRRTRG
jgi:hypothetical protein